jgi:hypothetical protein
MMRDSLDVFDSEGTYCARDLNLGSPKNSLLINVHFCRNIIAIQSEEFAR